MADSGQDGNVSGGNLVLLKNYHGAALNIAGWITMVCTCIAVILKIANVATSMRRVFVDDFVLAAAMVMVVGHTVSVNIGVSEGLGRYQSAINTEDLLAIQQSLYASQFLYVLSLGLEKVAILLFIKTLSRTKVSKLAVTALGSLSVLWSLIGVLVVAFQCSIPRPWTIFDQSRCIDMRAFWTVMGGLEIIINICVMSLPVYIVSKLNMKTKLKTPIVIVFFVRIIPCGLIIARLIFLYQPYRSKDFTHDSYLAILFAQLQLCVSVAIDTIPFLKTFTKRLQNGFFTMDLRNGPESEHLAEYLTKRTTSKSSALATSSLPESEKSGGSSTSRWLTQFSKIVHTRSKQADGDHRSTSEKSRDGSAEHPYAGNVGATHSTVESRPYDGDCPLMSAEEGARTTEVCQSRLVTVTHEPMP